MEFAASQKSCKEIETADGKKQVQKADKGQRQRDDRIMLISSVIQGRSRYSGGKTRKRLQHVPIHSLDQKPSL